MYRIITTVFFLYLFPPRREPWLTSGMGRGHFSFIIFQEQYILKYIFTLCIMYILYMLYILVQPNILVHIYIYIYIYIFVWGYSPDSLNYSLIYKIYKYIKYTKYIKPIKYTNIQNKQYSIKYMLKILFWNVFLF